MRERENTRNNNAFQLNASAKHTHTQFGAHTLQPTTIKIEKKKEKTFT